MLFHTFFTQLTTFIVFPGVIFATNITLFRNESTKQISLLMIFNICDTIGRFMGGVKAIRLSTIGL